jgi:hypothetical protein
MGNKIRLLTAEEMLYVAGGLKGADGEEIQEVVVTGSPLTSHEFFSYYTVTSTTNANLGVPYNATGTSTTRTYVDVNRDGIPDTPIQLAQSYNQYREQYNKPNNPAI